MHSVAKDPSFLCVDREDSDQTGRMSFCWFCHAAAHMLVKGMLVKRHKSMFHQDQNDL